MLAHGRWFSPGTLVSSTTKTGRHDIVEILLKVALKHTKKIKINSYVNEDTFLSAHWDLLLVESLEPPAVHRDVILNNDLIYVLWCLTRLGYVSSMVGVLQEAGIVYASRTSGLTTGLLVGSVSFILSVCCVVVFVLIFVLCFMCFMLLVSLYCLLLIALFGIL